MVVVFLSLAILQADWSQPPLFPTIFPNPSGVNGLEEYTTAMDLLRSGHFNAYEDWQSPEERAKNSLPSALASGRFAGQTVKPDPRYTDLVNRLDGLNLLQMRQEEVRQFGHALDLVDAGNGKDCVFPPTADSFKFPPVAEVFGLMHLGTNSSYVELCNGHGTAAVSDLAKVLVMSDRLARRNHFAQIVSMVTETTWTSWLNDNMDRLSLSDARYLEAAIDGVLSQPPACLDAYRKEILHAKDSVREMILSERKSEVTGKGKLEADVATILKSLSDSDVDALIQRVQQSILEKGDLLFNRITGPEQNWPAPRDGGSTESSPTRVANAADVEALYARNWTPPFAERPDSLLPMLKVRVQLRLARLYCRVLRFRWEANRLPRSFQELSPPDGYVFDPLTNGSFVYEVRNDGFRIYSKGWNQTGEVDLNSKPSRQEAPVEATP
ncbi:MAG: hypothetical protein P4L46_04660 [Fimbriimonas sp.]|nr:hypothetical protein [Fimbriimonas sp.]